MFVLRYVSLPHYHGHRVLSRCQRSTLRANGLQIRKATTWCCMALWTHRICFSTAGDGVIPGMVLEQDITQQALPNVRIILKRYSQPWRKPSVTYSACILIQHGPTIQAKATHTLVQLTSPQRLRLRLT